MRRVLFCAAGLVMAGCVAADGSDAEIPSWEEFRASASQDPTGAFIVDGDIPLRSEEQLHRYYDAYVASVTQPEGGYGTASAPLTINTVNGVDDRWVFPSEFRLTYCVSSDFGDRFDFVVSEMAKATTSWSKIVGVQFQYVELADCDNQDNNVVFDVRPLDGPYLARAFFPSDARADRELLIDEDAFSTTDELDLDGILRHELGHTLGFRHEHIRLVPPCTTEENTHNRTLTEYDVDSVMHYPECRPSGTGGLRQSPLDYVGAVSVYGLAPALLAAM